MDNADGCGLVVLAFVVIGVLVAISKARARERARRAYQDALHRLKRDPTNANLRQETLALGRKYANLMRDRRGANLFDEFALSNDISAACAAAARPPEARREVAAPQRSVEIRLADLASLKAKGLIDESEFSSRRREILKDV